MKGIVKLMGRRAKVLDVSRVEQSPTHENTMWVYERGLEEAPTAITDSRYGAFDLRICEVTADQMAEVTSLSAQRETIDRRLNEIAFDLAKTGEPMTLARLRELNVSR